MRIRTIKPEFWMSESIGRLSRDARLLFIGLWSFADDSGRARGAFPAISGTLFPYDRDAAEKMPDWFAELEAQGMVIRYKAEDGNTYYQLPNWLKHQKIEKPSPSKIPPFAESSPNIRRILPDSYPLEQGTGNRDQGPMEQGSGTRDLSCAKAQSGEASVNGVESEPKPKAKREPNPAWDALCEVTGISGALTQPEAARIGKSLKEITQACQGMDRDAIATCIRVRATRYKALFFGASLTDRALVSHWSKLAHDIVPNENPRSPFARPLSGAEERKRLLDRNLYPAEREDITAPTAF